MIKHNLIAAILCIFAAGAVCPLAAQDFRQMTLAEMFAAADSLNASIQAAESAKAASQVGVEVAKNAYLPNVNISASVGYNGLGYSFDRNFTNAVNEEIPGFGNNFAVAVSQVVFAGGAIKNGVEACELASQLAALSAEGKRQDVRFLIVGNSLEIKKIQNLLKVIDSNIEVVGQVIDDMKERYSNGTVLKNDITRFELQLQGLKQTRIQLDGALRIQQSQLAAALGYTLDVRIEPQVEDLDESSVEDGSHWRSNALESSIGVRSAELAHKLSLKEIDIARSERYPKIALYAADNLNGPDITTFISGKMAGFGSLDKNFNFMTVGIGLSYDLDNLYKTGKKIRQKRIASQQSFYDLENASRQIEVGANASYISYENALAVLETKAKSVELAHESFDVVRSQYESDLALVTDLLDATSRVLDSESQLVNARMDVIYNYYKLLYICGKI